MPVAAAPSSITEAGRERDVKSRRVAPHRWRAAVLAVLALLLIGGLALYVRSVALTVVDESRLAQNDLLDGVRLIRSAGPNLTEQQAATASGDFRRAGQRLGRVHAVLRDNPLVQIGTVIPWLRTQVGAAGNLTDIGEHLASTGQITADAVGKALSQTPRTPGKPSASPPERLLTLLNVLDPKLDEISRQLQAVSRDRADIPASGLDPRLQKAVHQLDGRFNAQQVTTLLEQLRADEPAIKHLLAADGRHTYLVLQQDPAELRATGGYIGSVGFLTFDHGRMLPYMSEAVERIDFLPDLIHHVLGGPGTATYVQPPYPLEHSFRLDNWELRDSNWSPDFPTAAQEAEFLLHRENGQRVDGVIAIDPYLVQRVLGVIGPVKIPETGDVVDANNFYEVTFMKVELTHGIQRKDLLGQAAQQILGKIDALHANQWFSLLQAIQSSCEGKSLQAYFNDAAIESMVTRQQCGGQVLPPKADGVMIVEANVGGQKDDFWMRRRYHLIIDVQPDGTSRHTLQLHYDGLSDHGFLLTGRWGYTGWLRVYLPAETRVITINGEHLTHVADLSRTVVQGWFYVQFDHGKDVTIVYDEPPAVTGLSNKQLTLSWEKQGGRFADPISVDVTVPAGWNLRSAELNGSRAAAHVTTDLSTNREFNYTFSTQP